MNLGFSDKITLNLPDSDIIYFSNFLGLEEATLLFRFLKNNVPWQQDPITVYGKTYLQPRLTALYGNNGLPYSYSNITMHPHSFPKELETIKLKIEEKTKTSFTSCLLNFYRDGKDSNGWHADNEKELGKNPIIASLSIGQERFFHLKHQTDKTQKHKILLEHGSLLLMKGSTQHYWQHQIAKTTRPIEERINLTFRIVKNLT